MRQTLSFVRCAALGVLLLGVLGHAQEDFRPVDKAEVAMTADSRAPGAAAELLEWSEFEDHDRGYSDHYYRIKIFTDQGKKYGDIEIPFVNGLVKIPAIKARVIRPDGTVRDFDGQIFDRTVVKQKRFSFQAKTLTLPDLQPGCIIEYSYRLTWPSFYSLYWGTHLELQQELFARKLKVELRTYGAALEADASMSRACPTASMWTMSAMLSPCSWRTCLPSNLRPTPHHCGK